MFKVEAITPAIGAEVSGVSLNKNLNSDIVEIQNTLLFHIFNRLYVVLVFMGLILKRNMSMKYV